VRNELVFEVLNAIALIPSVRNIGCLKITVANLISNMQLKEDSVITIRSLRMNK